MRQVVIFDFGGVMAEEGFREGLKFIAGTNSLDPEAFFKRARDLIYMTGYVTGTAEEHMYWQAVKREFKLTQSDEELRKQILTRFVLRPEMFAEVATLRSRGHTVALLTDQTDWLCLLDQENGEHVLASFQHIFNSYDLHMSKREPQLFRFVEKTLQVAPHDILFVDDSTENVRMATGLGWNVILFRDYQTFMEELPRHLKDN